MRPFVKLLVTGYCYTLSQLNHQFGVLALFYRVLALLVSCAVWMFQVLLVLQTSLSVKRGSGSDCLQQFDHRNLPCDTGSSRVIHRPTVQT